MDRLFYDRFSERVFERVPEGGTIPGRWLLRNPDGRNVFLNSFSIQSGTFLVPDLSGSWRVFEGQDLIQRGKTNRMLEPDELEAESIRDMGSQLNRAMAEKKTWFDWLDIVPLDPGLSDAVKPQPLEISIQRRLGHLEEVCVKPKTHLHVTVECVPVSKARRLPINAVSYLASHTEDWERQLIRGVLPKRILSEVRDDRVDIYENRVAARLIDHLAVYLGKRIRLTRRLLKLATDMEDYSSNIIGTHHLQERLCKVWAQAVGSNAEVRKSEIIWKRSENLERLKQRLLALMHSRLYQEVPRRSHVAPTLRMTNILANDQNYRRVADLWHEWVRGGHAKSRMPADVHREAQELCEGFWRFTLLLVIRALDQLGYIIREEDLDSPVTMCGRRTLEGHATTVECVWDEAGRISIEMGQSRLAVVAIPVSLGAAGSDKQVQEVLQHVAQAAGNATGMTIVLYVGNSDERSERLSALVQRQIYTVGNDPRARFADDRPIGFLPVSPWDIRSVERVGRAIRWFVEGIRFSSYPFAIKACREVIGTIDFRSADAWLKTSDEDGEITMRRPPGEREWERLGIDQIVNRACEEYENAITEEKRKSDELHAAKLKGRAGIGKLRHENAMAQQQLNKTKNWKLAVERFRDDLCLVRIRTESLLVCPACGARADPSESFRPRGRNCFLCTCECEMRWETRMCGNRHRYAVMQPSKCIKTEDVSIGWEDRIYGSDLLALPESTETGSWRFICPSCGEIS